MKNLKIFIIILTSAIFSLKLYAQTKVIVRAKAKDAKFLPGSLGVQVIIRDNLSKEILSKGTMSGTSGNTDKIMTDVSSRHKILADDKTSKYEALLDIKEPTFVDIEVYASFNRKNGTKKVTTQAWIIPNKHILGDGIVLEIPGFIVDILNPTTQQYIRMSEIKDGKILLKASITMACGCVISKGGTWDSEQYEIIGNVKHDGTIIDKIPLSYAGVWNNFEGLVPIKNKGDYEILVYAFDPITGNSGVDKINFTVL